MPETQHVLHMTTQDVRIVERTLKVFHSVLWAITGDGVATDAVRSDADSAAHVSGLVQEHSRGLCDCSSV